MLHASVSRVLYVRNGIRPGGIYQPFSRRGSGEKFA